MIQTVTKSNFVPVMRRVIKVILKKRVVWGGFVFFTLFMITLVSFEIQYVVAS